MAEHPIQMTPGELSASVIVRVAEKCKWCKGSGRRRGHLGLVSPCLACSDGQSEGAGHPNPYQVGDVLVHEDHCPRCNNQGYWYDYPRDQDGEFLGGEVAVQCNECPPEHRRTVTSVELVRLQEMDDDAITEWSGTDWTWPENVDTDGEFYTAEQRLERDRERCEERWDDANPEHPWASNPHVWKIGVEGGEKNG